MTIQRYIMFGDFLRKSEQAYLPWLIAGLLCIGVLLYYLAPILMPFLISAFLAYLLDPLIDKMELKGINRTLAVSIVFFLMAVIGFVLFFLLLPLLVKQVVFFIYQLPEYIKTLQLLIVPLFEQMLQVKLTTIDADKIRQLIQKNWQQTSDLLGNAVRYISSSTFLLLTFLTNALLIPVVTFYLLRDWNRMTGKIYQHIPRVWRRPSLRFARDSDEVLSAFIRGQLMVMLALSILYSIGLSIVGLKLAIMLGLIAGMASIVPYLGTFVGIAAASLAAFLQFQMPLPVIYVIVVFVIGQVLEGAVLTPLLVGDKIGLHPVAVIFVIMAGGQLAGFVGILIALPCAAVLMVAVRRFLNSYQQLL